RLPSSLCGGGGALGSALILDVVLLHLAVERGAVQAKDLRRFLLVPVGALERLQNGHLLDLGEGTVRRDRELLSRSRPLLADRFREVGGNNLTCFADQHGPLDGIFQLTNVTSPAVANQQVIGGGR